MLTSREPSVLAVALLWTGVLLALMLWSGPHYQSRRFGPSTYYPHVSHFATWLYLGLTTMLWGVHMSIHSQHPGPLVLLLLSVWHLKNAVVLGIAWRRDETIDL